MSPLTAEKCHFEQLWPLFIIYYHLFHLQKNDGILQLKEWRERWKKEPGVSLWPIANNLRVVWKSCKSRWAPKEGGSHSTWFL